MIEKRKPLTGTQKDPASLGDVNEVNPRTAGCTDPEEKIDPEEQLPDLTRFYKNRARNEELIRKCKHMLIAGYSPQRVACLLRLPLEKVKELHQASYNSKYRRLANANSYQNSRLALVSFKENATLADICTALSLPLYTVVTFLRENGITDAAMAPKMPPYDDPLCIEYRRVCERKAVSKHTPIEIRVKPRKKKSPATA